MKTLIKSPMKRTTKVLMKPLTDALMNPFANSLMKPLASSLTKAITNNLIKPLSSSLMKAITNDLIHPLSNALMHSCSRTRACRAWQTAALTLTITMGLGVATPLLTNASTVYSAAPNYRAVNEQLATSLLQQFQGTWYNHQGQPMLDIQNGYINSTQVTGIYNYAGSKAKGDAILRLQEKAGPKDLKFSWSIRHTPKDYLVVNDMTMLRNVPTVSYNESIAGVHLGMNASEVKAQLGNPSQIGRLNNLYILKGWYYGDKKIALSFKGDTVDGIYLLKGSALRFKNSGLNADNALATFAEEYNFKSTSLRPGTTYPIGQDEYMYFDEQGRFVWLKNQPN